LAHSAAGGVGFGAGTCFARCHPDTSLLNIFLFVQVLLLVVALFVPSSEHDLYLSASFSHSAAPLLDKL
jgi:hypothetical protein